jgi:serine/threonine protein kinase
MKYRQNLTASSHSCTKSPKDDDATSICSKFGTEDFILPFISIQKLGGGGHGFVDEVMSMASKKILARKSVIRKSTELLTSSQMAHLKNELAVLKELSNPHLVKLIRAYSTPMPNSLTLSCLLLLIKILQSTCANQSQVSQSTFYSGWDVSLLQ